MSSDPPGFAGMSKIPVEDPDPVGTLTGTLRGPTTWRSHALRKNVRPRVPFSSLGGSRLPSANRHNGPARPASHRDSAHRVALDPRGARGHPDQPLSDESLLAKFLSCASLAIPRGVAESIAAEIEHLEEIPDVRVLTSRLAGATD